MELARLAAALVPLLLLVSFCDSQNDSDVDPSSLADSFLASFEIDSSPLSATSITPSSIILSTAVFSQSPVLILDTSSLIALTSSSIALTSSSSSTTTSVAISPSSIPPNTNLSDISNSASACSCDLQVLSCDTDCCCDTDCTTDEISVFSQCLNEQETSLVSRCLSTAVLFQSYLLSTKDSGLFCIYTDNYPGRVSFPDSSLATTRTELNRQVILYSRTGDLVVNPSSSSHSSTSSLFYRSGDPIIITYYSNVTGYLALPTSLNGDACHDGNPITFLNNQTSSCVRYIRPDGAECSQSSSFNALNYYVDISVSPFPKLTDNDSFIGIELRQLKCFNLTGHLVSCNSNPLPPTYNRTSLICDNALLSIEYIIVHNGSNGIIRILVDIAVGQATVGAVEQRFSVRFIPVLDTVSNSSFRRSGNPGYVDGEPVLAGVLLNDVVNLDVNRMNWLTLLKGGSNGECNKNHKESVTFKDNMRTSCLLRFSSFVCEEIRQQTNEMLRIEVNRIGIYGNSDPANISQWIPVFNTTELPTSTECSSIVTGVQITLFYSYSGQVNSPVAFITGAQVQYVTQNLSISCTGPVCTSQPSLTVSLQSTVVFVPVYSVPAQVLKTITLNARSLPEDFFYPILTTSGTDPVTFDWIIITLLIIIIITEL